MQYLIRRSRRQSIVKKILALAAVAGAVLFIVRRSRANKVDTDVWREATAETNK
ncbi:MAG TPA: DLW-39 family protein [Pseudonocardiaceae bacterium]